MGQMYLLEERAEEFWCLAGGRPEDPCDLESAVIWAFPLEISRILHLQVSDVRTKLRRHGIALEVTGSERRLRGCLVAYGEGGLILLDASDPPEEQRFTLAHELAHYLLDYYTPRQRALAALGESIRPVLDGLRPPTLEERVHALLSRVSLGVLQHLMERPEAGLPTGAVLDAEDWADRLALELLAPAAPLLDRLSSAVLLRNYPERMAALSQLLTARHGLPLTLATDYARLLIRHQGGPSFRDWLFGNLG